MSHGLRKRLMAAAVLLAPMSAKAQTPPAPPLCQAITQTAKGEYKVWYGTTSTSTQNGIGTVGNTTAVMRSTLTYPFGSLKVGLESVLSGSTLQPHETTRVRFLGGGLADFYRLEARGESISTALNSEVDVTAGYPPGNEAQIIAAALLAGESVKATPTSGAGSVVTLKLDPAAVRADQTAASKRAVQLSEDVKNQKCTAVGSACFLTTATVGALGLEDDCWELATLRRFRDGALARSMEGPGLIAAYYDRAPRIVDRINARVDGKRVWLQTYFTSILPSAAAAALGLNALALAIYCRMTERLERLAA